MSKFLALCLLLCSCNISAQDDRFDTARCMFMDGRTLSAARLFQDISISTKDPYLRIKSSLAEGECYYALDLPANLSSLLDQVRKEMTEQNYFVAMPDSAKLVLRESYFKLCGSYDSMVSPEDPEFYTAAEEAYAAAWADIQTLRATTLYDNREAERILLRELVGLYYNRQNYTKAYIYSQAALIPLLDSGFGADGAPTEDFVEAVSAHALVLARLKRFDEAEQTLEFIPDWSKYPAYLRRIGKIAMLRHEDMPEASTDAATDAYRQYRDHMIREIETRLPEMTPEEREQYWLSLQPFLLDAYRLGNADPGMLFNMALLSKGYLIAYASEKKKATWETIQKSLKKGECAIEFVEYAGKDESRKMGALVLRKDAPMPLFVDMFDVESFSSQRLYSSILGRSFPVGDAIVRTEGGRGTWTTRAMKNALFEDASLRSQIWTSDLQEAIGNASRVYFAPDGIFHALAIEYMLPEDMSGKRVFRLSSTRTLLDRNKNVKRSGNALLVGGINYEAVIHPERTGNDEQAYSMSKDGSKEIEYLQGSLAEVDSISAIRSNPSDIVLKGAEATDERVCSLFSKNWDIVHIATHGAGGGNYSESDLKPVLSDQCMSASFLLLAGVKTAASDNSFNPDLYDGCLSSRELSRENLSNVQLIVLSACQTGLGYTSPEGVYGLQRGLKKAGAHSMILSLWSVADDGTQTLMEGFYRSLASGKSVHDAFEQARDTMLKDGQSPYFADPFILIDVFE